MNTLAQSVEISRHHKPYEIRHVIAWRWYPDDMLSTLRLYGERTGNSANPQLCILLNAPKTFSLLLVLFLTFKLHRKARV